VRVSGSVQETIGDWGYAHNRWRAELARQSASPLFTFFFVIIFESSLIDLERAHFRGYLLSLRFAANFHESGSNHKLSI